MKHLILILLSVILLTGFHFAMAQDYLPLMEAEEPEGPQIYPYCPVSKIHDNNKCMNCHKLKIKNGKVEFGINEIDPVSKYNIPYALKIVHDGEKFTPYFLMESISSDIFKSAMDYIRWHPEFGKHIIMEIHSPGGSLMETWRIISIMDELKAEGWIFETHGKGFAASAGFLLMCNGNKGYRFVNPMAEFMWHELWTLAFLKLETPSSKEHEAKIFRHLMDTIHNWLTTRSHRTKEELDNLVEFKEYWLNGTDMVEMGFADDFIGRQL